MADRDVEDGKVVLELLSKYAGDIAHTLEAQARKRIRKNREAQTYIENWGVDESHVNPDMLDADTMIGEIKESLVRNHELLKLARALGDLNNRDRGRSIAEFIKSKHGMAEFIKRAR